MDKTAYYCPKCGGEDVTFRTISTCFPDRAARVSLDELTKPKRKLISDYVIVSLVVREATCTLCGYSVIFCPTD